MRVTHVIRGADHLSNTPKQILLFDALGADQPKFIHVPLILGEDKYRLSKRHGATRFWPIATREFCLKRSITSWSCSGGRTGPTESLFDQPSLVEAFSLEGISKADAVFNPDKLGWFNGQYINALPVEELAGRLRSTMENVGIWKDRFGDSHRDGFHS